LRAAVLAAIPSVTNATPKRGRWAFKNRPRDCLSLLDEPTTQLDIEGHGRVRGRP